MSREMLDCDGERGVRDSVALDVLLSEEASDGEFILISRLIFGSSIVEWKSNPDSKLLSESKVQPWSRSKRTSNMIELVWLYSGVSGEEGLVRRGFWEISWQL